MPVQVFPAGGPPRAYRAMSSPPTVPAPDLELERSRRAAEDRADAAEGNLRGIQKQLKDSLARTAELERRLVAAESTTHTSDSESAALRERVSDTTERLKAAELDAKAQRQRLALKQQEFEEALGRLASIQTNADLVEELRRELAGAESRADGTKALQAKLEAAENRAEEMANEMARMEADLDYAADQFHMTKLSEALRDIDHDGNDEATDGPLEHPVIIRGGGTGRGAVIDPMSDILERMAAFDPDGFGSSDPGSGRLGDETLGTETLADETFEAEPLDMGSFEPDDLDPEPFDPETLASAERAADEAVS